MNGTGPNSSSPLDSPAAKVLAVVGTIARRGSASISAIADGLDLPLPTAHRICLELERLGYVQRVPGTRHWTVARATVDMAAAIIAAASGDALVQAILRRVTDEIGEMCSFAVQVGDEVVYVAGTEAPHAVTLSFRTGRKAPLFCTSSGRLFLSRLGEEALEKYFIGARLTAYTRYTLTDKKKLIAEVHRVRAQRYAMTSHQYVLHVLGAAVPVENDNGTMYGALSIAAPDLRMNFSDLKKQIPLLHRAASDLARVWRQGT